MLRKYGAASVRRMFLCDSSMSAGARRLTAVVLAALSALLSSSPAPALVEKVMKVCSGQLCPFFRASFAAPEGWQEDVKTGLRLGVRVFVPAGESFDTAPAMIYALARLCGEGEDLAAAVAAHRETWRRRAPDVAITRLADVPRRDGNRFELHDFVSPRVAVQPFERVAIATDGDAEGNGFIVRLVLTAKSDAALKSAEQTFHAMLERY